MKRLCLRFIFGIVLGASVAAFAQQTSSEHAVRAVLNGRRVAVFDTAKDSCELIDIPDTQARAFRDYKGMIHLVSSHYVMRANLGPTLESVKHNCQVAYSSNHDGNPANFDDTTWLNAFYTLDGKRIAAWSTWSITAGSPKACVPQKPTTAPARTTATRCTFRRMAATTSGRRKLPRATSPVFLTSTK
jgi:hypothetical protein